MKIWRTTKSKYGGSLNKNSKTISKKLKKENKVIDILPNNILSEPKRSNKINLTEKNQPGNSESFVKKNFKE